MSPMSAYILGLLTPMLVIALFGVVGIALVLLDKLRKWLEPLSMFTAWGDRRYARKMRVLVTPAHAYESQQLLEYLRSDDPWGHLSHLIRFYRIMRAAQPKEVIRVLEMSAQYMDEWARTAEDPFPAREPYPSRPRVKN